MSTDIIITNDALLLAMVIDYLIDEKQPRDLNWILAKRSIDDKGVVDTLIPKEKLSFFSKILQKLTGGAPNEKKRLSRVVNLGVKAGCLEFLSIKNKEGLIPTEAGLVFTIESHREIGRSLAKDKDDTYLAAEICNVIEGEHKPLNEGTICEIILLNQFGELNGSTGRKAMVSAFLDELPHLFQKGSRMAKKLGWAVEKGGKWYLTEKGKKEGPRYFARN